MDTSEMFSINDSAKAQGKLEGRILRFSMGDSEALYVVNKVNDKTAEVNWIEYGDGLIYPLLGEGSIMTISMLERMLKLQDSMDSAMGG